MKRYLMIAFLLVAAVSFVFGPNLGRCEAPEATTTQTIEANTTQPALVGATETATTGSTSFFSKAYFSETWTKAKTGDLKSIGILLLALIVVCVVINFTWGLIKWVLGCLFGIPVLAVLCFIALAIFFVQLFFFRGKKNVAFVILNVFWNKIFGLGKTTVGFDDPFFTNNDFFK